MEKATSQGSKERGGEWYSISLFQYRDLGASTIVEFRGKMHL